MIRRCLLTWRSLAVATAIPAAALANVYPTNLGQSSNSLDKGAAQIVNLNYLLNEDATGVTVQVLDAGNNVVRTINGGAQTRGSQSVPWDGKDDANNFLPNGNYSFRVSTAGAAKGGWTQISTDGTLNNFELPRGVAVNKNPDSPYYGRIYVSNPRTNGTGAGRAMGDGIYMLNADLSDSGIAGGTGPHAGGVNWGLDGAGATGPFRLEVGPDDSLYITNWSDAHSGLWQADPNMTAASEVLDSTGRAASGLNATHGSISDVIVVGTGAGRTIYTTDEDFAPTGSILRYDIGNNAVHNGAPSGFAYEDTGNTIINFFNSIARASDGTFWMSQTRSAGTDEPSLIQIDAAGNIIWESLASLGSPDPLRGAQGIAYDPVNNLIAVVTNISGNIIIFDPVTKAILTSFAFGSTTNTDVAFDNAGNLYVGNRSAERVRIWSPPNGGRYGDNLFSTNSFGALGSIQLVPEPGTLAFLAVASLVFARRRR